MKNFFTHVWIILALFAGNGFSANSRFSELINAEFDELDLFNETKIFSHDMGSSFAINNLIHANTWVEPTPSQPQGPFYPIRLPSEVDTDLTVLDNGPQAQGTVVYVQGQVMDQDGNVIVGATVEIWQACASGKYNHPRDPNSATIDPNFQYYGVTTSDQTGKYIFKTIVPGPYPASATWWRPEHIHMMVRAAGFKSVTTQLYFDPMSFPGTQIGKYNATDLILAGLSLQEQQRLIVSFQENHVLNKNKLGVFNIILKRM